MGYPEDNSTPGGDKEPGAHRQLPQRPHPNSSKGEVMETCLPGGSGSGPKAEPAADWVPCVCPRCRQCPTRARSQRPTWGRGHSTGGEGVNGIGPTQQMENFIMK